MTVAELKKIVDEAVKVNPDADVFVRYNYSVDGNDEEEMAIMKKTGFSDITGFLVLSSF